MNNVAHVDVARPLLLMESEHPTLVARAMKRGAQRVSHPPMAAFVANSSQPGNHGTRFPFSPICVSCSVSSLSVDKLMGRLVPLFQEQER